jgi:hypothetical protein
MKIVLFRPALAVAVAAGCTLSAHAQSPYVGEALNYSRLQFGGPARTLGIAGANVALGADFGNLASNPAGLGLYQKSEFHLAPGLGLASADAAGTGLSRTADKNSFHIASAGVVFTNRRPDDESGSAWRGGSFALGFTRQADFNTSFRYSGQVAENQSFFQRLREPGNYTNINSAGYQSEVADLAGQDNNGQGPYSTLDGLAYGTYLTDTIYDRRSGLATLVTRLRNGAITQGETVTTSGSISQFDLGYGGSYKDRLYIGGAVGIVSSNRRQTRTFTESENDPSTRFDNLQLQDEVKTTGSGFNARVGLIYRVVDALRLGASIQTPTFLRMTETSQMSLTSTFTPQPQDNPANPGASASLPSAEYTYNIITPFRASGGAAVTIGKSGFITGDAEYVGYQKARLSSADDATYGDAEGVAADNQTIAQAYKGTFNFRLGAEARLDIFRLRVGFANYGDPYKNNITSRDQRFYTAGVGLRQSNFFFDLAGVYTTFDQQYSPYSLASGQQPVISVNNSRYTTTVTAGLTF